MNAEAIIEKAVRLGITMTVVGNRIQCRPGSIVPPDFVAELRQHKPELIQLLAPAADCRNPLTPHASHEYSWECDPYKCFCYQEYQRPLLCQGVPCRWVWLSDVRD